MRNIKHAIFFILGLSIFIVLSGCVNSSSTYLPRNSIIKEFSSIPSQIYSNEDVYLKMRLENDQDFFVKNIYAYVYNVGNDWGIRDVWGEKTHKVSTSSWLFDVDASFYVSEDFEIGDNNVIINGEVKINDMENILKGKLPEISVEDANIFIMRDDISIMIYDLERFFDIAYKNNYERVADVNLQRVYTTADKLPPVYINYLYPPPENGMGRGEEIEIYWVVKPPEDIPKGKKFSNEVKARVCYEGVNRLSDAIHFISSNEFLYRDIKHIRKKRVTSHSGPVSLTLEVNDPVIITDTNRVISMVITVKNEGNGVVTSESCKEVMGINKRKRDIERINKFNIRIEGDIDFQCDIQNENFYLMRDNSIKIPVFCYVQIPKGLPEQERYLDVEISYTYYEDVSTKINVEGV